MELIAFLINGQFSNVGSGESVNCDLGDREENDIHLNLVQSKPPANPTDTQLEDLECASAVVEISRIGGSLSTNGSTAIDDEGP